MEKKYSTKALSDIFSEDEIQTEDIIITYMVTKESDSSPNMEALINVIISYVQNSEVYFKSVPGFVHGVLVFTIVGTKEEHDKIKFFLADDIKKLECKLSWE